MKRKKKYEVNKYKYIGVKCKSPGCEHNARAMGYCKVCYDKRRLERIKNKDGSPKYNFSDYEYVNPSKVGIWDVLEEIIQDYYLFIPIAILNEAIDLPEFKNKYKKMYDQIILLKEIKKDLKEL